MKDKMMEITLNVSFNTPAFLGNATQEAQWRTPPFKALLRQWWRVVKAKDVNYDHNKLLVFENELFGKAAEKGKLSNKSVLRLRLNNWQIGTAQSITNTKSLRLRASGPPVLVNSYMGYGPVSHRSNETRRSIAPESESAELWLGFPMRYKEEIAETIQLMAWFGTLGSRSRNAWGSLNIISAVGVELKALTKANLEIYSRHFDECLNTDWAHAIGYDKNGLLVWKTSPKSSWNEVMADLASIKMKFRNNFPFTRTGTHNNPEKRHVIAYPVTKHPLQGLGNSARLANSLRFKIIKEEKQYYGLIFHLPCAASEKFLERVNNKNTFKSFEKTVWPDVHNIIGQFADRLS